MEWEDPHPGRNRAPAWQHFKVSRDKRYTMCNHCATILSYKSHSTSSMYNHLAHKHPDVSVVRCVNVQEDTSEVAEWITPNPERYRSFAWSHFEMSRDRKQTRCTHCHEIMKYLSNSTKFMYSHLETNHPELWQCDYESPDDVNTSETGESVESEWLDPNPRRLRAPAWQHFKVSNDKTKTKCNHCEAVLSFSGNTTSAMNSHLTAKHRHMEGVEQIAAAIQRRNKSNRLSLRIVSNPTHTTTLCSHYSLLNRVNTSCKLQPLALCDVVHAAHRIELWKP